MDIVRFAISRPVTVAVGVILVVMFGLIGVGAIPIQLTPTVDRPIIRVATTWPGRSPEEVIEEITKEQEEQLKGLAGLKSMKSTSNEGGNEITLEFFIETDIQRALQEVSDALRQVPEYPDDVDEPTITATEGDTESAIAWVIIDVDPAYAANFPDFDIATLEQAIDRDLKPFLERVEGVAEINVYGGREREVRVLVDNLKLAQRGLTHQDLLTAIRGENTNVSAGSISEGKRDYRVRVMGQYRSIDDVLNTVVAYRDTGPVFVRDVAEVEMGHEKRRGFVRSMGYPSIAINATRRTGSNVMEVMSGLRDRLEQAKRDVLPGLHPEVGPHLRLRQVYDETIYIDSAVSLVTGNLWIGGLIAAFVLILFLRSFVATGVISLAIPISVVGTFLILLAMGRTLNVISLAGLAFAVGMVVDNAIVVLENIDRHRRMGKSAARAAYDGGKEVWGAVLASTLTTVAVFIPVLTIQEEAGQLFRDISLAIVASVVLSLVVSITVIPAACAKWLPASHEAGSRVGRAFQSLFGLAPLMGALNRELSRWLYWILTGWRAWTVRPAFIIALTVLSIIGSAMLMPPMDYLPAGNRNLVFGGLLIPPGYSVEQMEIIARGIEERVGEYVSVDPDDEAAIAALPPIPRSPGRDPKTGELIPTPPFDPVGIENFFIGSFGGGMFCGATSTNDRVVIPVGTLLSSAMSGVPDSYGGASQSSLFGRGLGAGNTVDIEISGTDLPRVQRAADALFMAVGGDPKYGFQSVNTAPSNFNLPQQEWQITITRTGQELGLTTAAVGTAVRAMFDGVFAGDYRDAADTIDINVLPKGGRLAHKEQLADVPIATPRGPIVPVDSVVSAQRATAPQSILRIEELPSVIVSVRPPPGEPVEQVMRELDEKYLGALRAAGLIDSSMRVRLEGTAAQLEQVRAALLGPRPDPAHARAGWQRALIGSTLLLGAAGVAAIVFAGVRFLSRRDPRLILGGVGLALFAAVLGAMAYGVGVNPELLTARFVWAIIVTYLLMAALFESFLYPFVIMFTVPLAIVGGFAGLSIVHYITATDPTIAAQNLDVLTMLGFVILIGVVVNNAILIVHQALNLMGLDRGGGVPEGEPLPARRAIAESVRTRVRPVFMSTMTSVGGMLPLVIAPGAGSELYRGLGAVVVGGLLVSTIFTLLLVPMVFSLVFEMREGAALLFARAAGASPPSTPARAVPAKAKPAHPRAEHPVGAAGPEY